ncbi:hypothetical protein IU510_20660 [Nocardia cyriacigeorgica]|uniref:hypothetical protein n=1 Tax=Nocardia cyriacigeorgica TaxID=135487 RepID=UPI00189501AE|nr:hypothetical protein [Nocardia cyriacigeorgica]MBF6100474.1 hypothetical protein [Nocardia cyriacigeorgica]MBF6320308.1 hypothetical protein [Nocardia cyriacigeorgica]MBF6346316.1 hypothetical protein [Nocardia cyriacigeorgica]MBF6534206.1 hypothetical protein [Nocardia cyriacigeorgica]
MYFEVDPNDPSKFVYLPEEQMEAVYWEKADDYPNDLAELYLGFHDFARIEFLVFRDRLSAAIFLWRSANSAADRALGSLGHRKRTADRAAPPPNDPAWNLWYQVDYENDLDENIYTVEQARTIACGAAAMTAVAALEALIDDLTPPNSSRRGGLHIKMSRLLDRIAPPPDIRSDIEAEVTKVRDRRNDYAHALTGSPWPRPTTPDRPARPHTVFDAETLEDTLYTVGEIAVWLEGQLLNTETNPD